MAPINYLSFLFQKSVTHLLCQIILLLLFEGNLLDSDLCKVILRIHCLIIYYAKLENCVVKTHQRSQKILWAGVKVKKKLLVEAPAAPEDLRSGIHANADLFAMFAVASTKCRYHFLDICIHIIFLLTIRLLNVAIIC